MAKVIMIQGTASNVGKSVLVAGLCRIFKQQGYRVAPFKAQNMALNSYITADGMEMGRAQVMQAEAAGIAPDVRMNPILLKPTSDVGSQVIVNGRSIGNQSAKTYWGNKKALFPIVEEAFRSLAEEYDIIVVEGAGSPAEINLKQDDLVNMGLAKRLQIPVLLVGDIDRGGVFASLYGTIALLEPEEQNLVCGMIINKFRGDRKILQPGLDMLEQLTQKKVLGVIPYKVLDLDEEDSLAERLTVSHAQSPIQIGLIRFPHLSNFTDFAGLERACGVTYVQKPIQLEAVDCIILPGTKNTMADLQWLRTSGLESMIYKKHCEGVPILGICGGYQMLGETLTDPWGVEAGGTMRGMGLLPAHTTFGKEKMTTQVTGKILELKGIFQDWSGLETAGYEIHMGATTHTGAPFQVLKRGVETVLDGCYCDNVYGTYQHGILDAPNVVSYMLTALGKQHGYVPTEIESPEIYKEKQYDALAAHLQEHLDIQAIAEILEVQKP